MESILTSHSRTSTPPNNLNKLKAAFSAQTMMDLSAVFLAGVCALFLLAILLVVLGVNFRRPFAGQGVALYNPATEVVLRGSVERTFETACPVSDGEMGSHLLLKTADGTVQVHLAPGRVMRSQKLSFAPGDQLLIVGSKVRIFGANGPDCARDRTRAG
jgi:hypothetical protein